MRNLFLSLLCILLAFGFSTCRKGATPGTLKIIPYRDGDLWGFVKPGGQIVVPPKYQNAYLYEDGYGRIFEGERSGLVSPDGKVLLEPKYSYIADFRHGRAIYSNQDGKLGYLDEQGREVIPAQYDQAFGFNEGFAAVQKGNEYFLIKPDGSIIANLGNKMPVDYDPSSMWDTKPAEAKTEYLLFMQQEPYGMGLMDKNGKEILAPKYQSLSIPVNGVIIAGQEEYSYLLKMDGTPLNDQQFMYLFRLDENRIIGQISENQAGVMDNQGKTIIPFEYNSLSKGPGNTLIAYKGDKAGLIDEKGKILIPFEYASLYHHMNQLVAANQDYKMGVLSSSNQVLLPLEYDAVEPIALGRYAVEKNGKRGLVGEGGKVILPLEFEANAMGEEHHEHDGYYEEKPVVAVLFFKGMQGMLYTPDGKLLSEKKFMYAGVPDAMGLTYATDVNGRDNLIGPDGKIYAKDPELKKVTVNNVQALYQALDNDTEITLEDGVYDLSKVQGTAPRAEVYSMAEYNMPDRSLLIKDARNLHLKAKNNGKVKLVTPYEFVPVIRAEQCYNLTLTGLVIGHDVKPGLCEGAVLTPVGCNYFVVDNCDLYGSGTFGIEAESSSFIGLSNSTIRECTRGIMALSNCYNGFFENCTMKDNTGDHMVQNNACSMMVFSKVSFQNNHTPKAYGPFEFFRLQDTYTGITLRDCTFTNCSSDYFATHADGIVETNTDRKGMTTSKGLYRQKEAHMSYPRDLYNYVPEESQKQEEEE